MRVLFTSDWHLDAHTLGVPRRPELLRYLDVVQQAAAVEEVDVVAFAGDACDPGHMLQSQYAADIIDAFRKLGATRTLVAIAGNHDVVEVAGPLTTLTPARVAFENDGNKHIFELPGTVAFPDHRVVFLALPYVARSQVEAAQPLFVDLLDQAFSAAAMRKKANYKLVVMGHMTVPGAKLGSETVELSRGRDLDLPLERIAALQPDLVVNGHYHKPQVVQVGGVNVVIPGSPASFSTDDAAQGKGYTIAEI
jgi:DNA repair exonuclease SbcCD nuclease subunit